MLLVRLSAYLPLTPESPPPAALQDFVVQFQVAFSATVKGVGVFAGQPYHCAVTMFKGDKCVRCI